MSNKNKVKGQWKDYKEFTLKNGTKFLARDEEAAGLYRRRCESKEND